jgi:hypothetical protein
LELLPINGVVDEETQKNDLYIVSGWGRSNYIGQDLTLPILPA